MSSQLQNILSVLSQQGKKPPTAAQQGGSQQNAQSTGQPATSTSNPLPSFSHLRQLIGRSVASQQSSSANGNQGKSVSVCLCVCFLRVKRFACAGGKKIV